MLWLVVLGSPGTITGTVMAARLQVPAADGYRDKPGTPEEGKNAAFGWRSSVLDPLDLE